MKARPILMSAPMIRALLDGRKTQTRRVVKPQPLFSSCQQSFSTGLAAIADAAFKKFVPDGCPYGQPGDLLWVRESLYRLGRWQQHEDETGERESRWRAAEGICYHADQTELPERNGFSWRSFPSIHMPRRASRLTLELTEVRVERLQDISDADAIAEGIEPVFTRAGQKCGWLDYQHEGDGMGYCTNPRESYASLWESINARGSWELDPWVWCLSFRVHQQNVDAFLATRRQP